MDRLIHLLIMLLSTALPVVALAAIVHFMPPQLRTAPIVAAVICAWMAGTMGGLFFQNAAKGSAD